MDKVLGIDYGQKRIGLAIGNTTAKIASPLEVIDNSPDITNVLLNIIRREGAETVVLGLPRNLEGEETKQTAKVRKFADKLQAALDSKLVLQDEALTSEQVKSRLNQEKKPLNNIDSAAAALILQDYLNTL